MNILGICAVLLASGQGIADGPAYDDPNSVFYAARKGDFARVQALCEKDPELIDKSDNFKRTPLLYAAKAGHAKIVEYLLTEGSKSVYHLDRYDFSAVHWAAMYAKNDVLRVLSRHKVDLNCRSKDGQTPLHLAMGNIFSNAPKHEDTVRLLVSLNVDVNAKDKSSLAPIHQGATLVGKVESVRALLESSDKVEIDIRDNGGGTALHKAAAFGKADVADALLAKGADPTAVRKDGKMPIDLANECLVENRKELILRVFAKYTKH